MNRNRRDCIGMAFLWLATLLSIGVLVAIVSFVFIRGIPQISFDFITRDWQDKTTFVQVEGGREAVTLKDSQLNGLGVTFTKDEKGNLIIESIKKGSPVKKAVDLLGDIYALEEKDIVTKIQADAVASLSLEEIMDKLNACIENEETIKFKVTRPGGGIRPMLISTLYIIILSLAIVAPIGILAALYLTEYAKKGKVLRIIQFAIQMLAGIPSIIYGLFGMLVFVKLFRMQYSILAGAFTLSILLLPTIISTTSEAIYAIPKGYRESSLGLGATKLQTNFKIVLPGALPGILVSIILSVGRIVGESAALIFTAGTVAQIPSALTGNQAGAATLTTKLYQLLKEEGDVSTACSIAVVIIVMIWCLNIVSKWITKRFVQKAQ